MQLIAPPERDIFIAAVHAAGKPGGKTVLAYLTETLTPKLGDPCATIHARN